MDYKNSVILALNNEIDNFDSNLVVVNKVDANGDYSFPCFSLSKTLRKSPIIIAEELASKIKIDGIKIEAKAGYVNFYINKSTLAKEVFSNLQKSGENYFVENIGKSKIIAIDFSSVNLAKHFHIGHMRNTILGASLSNMFKTYGYNVKKLNYLGDFGISFGSIIATAKHLGIDILKCNVSELQNIYAQSKDICADGTELKKQAQKWTLKINSGDIEATKLFNAIKKTTLDETQTIFDEFNIKFDSFNGEAYYEKFTPNYLKELEQKNISQVGEGGAIIVDLTPYGLTVCVLVSGAGYTLYPLRDIAAAVEREKEHNFDKLIYITATEQIAHFKNVFKIVELLGYKTSQKLEHIAYGRYSLEDGKLSSRYGAKALLKDILTEAKLRAKNAIIEKGKVEGDITDLSKKIGIGALVYNALSTTRSKDIVFNLDRTLQFDGETGPYLQYVLARINSLFVKAQGQGINGFEFNEKLLTEEELKIYRLLYFYKQNNITALNECEPSLISKYLIDIAKTFNQFYNNNKIITEDVNLTKSRLSTCYAVSKALKFGFNLLGIPVVEKM